MNIHRIKTGKVRIKENQLSKTRGIQPDMMKVLFGTAWSDWLPIYAWIIEHSEGIYVVDTGETHKTGNKAYLPSWHPYYALAVDFDVQPEDEIGPQMKTLGLDPETDVDKVIMTHLHTDHAGGMHHFPNAEFLIDRREYQSASGWTGILAGYLPHRWPEWLSPTLSTLPAEPFGPFERSLSITSDDSIRLVSSPGHVANHRSVIVRCGELYYFLAGDASYTQENMLRSIPDGVGTKQTVETLERIQEFARQYPTIYLPSHDPDAARRMDEREVVPLYQSTQVAI